METDLNKLRDRVYKIACEHGLHDEEIFTGNNIMLIIEGIINASKANRNNRHANVKEFLLRNDKSIMRTEDRDYFNYIAFCQEIKDSVEDELADIVIRLLEFGGIKKIDMNIPKWSSPISEVDERIIEIGTFDNFCYMLISSLITGRICHISCLIYAILKWCKNKNIDLFQHIEWKMRYNIAMEKTVKSKTNV